MLITKIIININHKIIITINHILTETTLEMAINVSYEYFQTLFNAFEHVFVHTYKYKYIYIYIASALVF